MLDPVKLRLNYAHDLSDSSSILLVVRIKPSLDLEPVAVFEKKKGEKKRSQTNLYSHGRSAISFLFSLPLPPPLPLDLRAFYSTFPIPDDEREKESNWNARQIRIIRYWLIPSASIAVAINVKHQTKPTLFQRVHFQNNVFRLLLSISYFVRIRVLIPPFRCGSTVDKFESTT